MIFFVGILVGLVLGFIFKDAVGNTMQHIIDRLKAVWKQITE